MNDERGILKGFVQNRKLLVATGIVAALLLVASYLLGLTNNGYIELTGRGDLANNEITAEIIMPRGQKPINITLKTGETRKLKLKKGSYRINASSGSIKSVDFVVVKGNGTSRATVPGGEELAVRKIGSNAEYCPVVVAGQMYSYNCSGSGQIYKHVAISNSTLNSRVALFNDQEFSVLQQFHRGLLGLADSADHNQWSLVYVNLESGVLQEVSLPQSVKALFSQERPNVIVNPGPDETRFLLVFLRGRAAYLFNNLNDSNPIKLDVPPSATLNTGLGLATFSFYNNRVISYSGHSEGTEDILFAGDEASKNTSTFDNFIYEFDFAGKIVKKLNLPKDLVASNVYKITDSFYAVSQNSSLTIYYATDKNFRPIYELEGDIESLTIDDKVYIANDGILYRFQGHDNGSFGFESVFNSSAVSVSGLYRGPNGLLFTGYTDRSDPRPLDIYQLLSDKKTTPLFEERVPFASLSRYITGYDYDDKTIVFYLGASGGSQGPSYKDLLESFKKRLDELGIDVGGRDVQLGAFN